MSVANSGLFVPQLSKSRVVAICIASFTLLPLSYYAYVETIRFRVIRKRRRRYQATRITSDQQSSPPDIRSAIVDRFASLKIAGRFVNVTQEWREQGAWEWLFHKLVWTPLTGRIGWTGGLSSESDKEKAYANDLLRIEKPKWDLLFGPPPVKEDHLSQSWDKLSQSTRERTPEEVILCRDFTYTWIGQSTAYITLNGVAILTDPIFAMRPVDSVIGPVRIREPPCNLADLRKIDLVLVSHNHLDHLGTQEVEALGNSVLWIIPGGVGRWFDRQKIHNYVEMDWWQTLYFRGLEITCTPAQHWSARSPLDTNRSLWCSFVVRSSDTKQSFFHCGDTGYSEELYSAIGNLFGPLSLALLPIGSYEPRWHMKCQHCNPEDAVRIHRHLQSKHTVGVHWGTWIMSDERWDDPPKDLAAARILLDVDDAEFAAGVVGRTVRLP